jgi:hypothetical protein
MNYKNHLLCFIVIPTFGGCLLYNGTMRAQIISDYETRGAGMGWSVKLMSESTYDYSSYGCLSSEQSEGYWSRNGDTLILNSKFTPRIKSQIEMRESSNDKIRLIIKDSQGNPWAPISIYHITSDSTYRLSISLDFIYDDTIPSYRFSHSQLSKLGRDFYIPADDFQLKFSLRDTNANKIIVSLNYTVGGFSRIEFFKERRFLISKDTLFLFLSNGYPYRDFPAYDIKKN